MVISGHQSSSKLIRTHQWSSVVISGHQSSSVVIRPRTLAPMSASTCPVPPLMVDASHEHILGYLRREVIREVIRAHQWSSVFISAHQWSSERSSELISGHQWSSVVIRAHQWSSMVISGHQSSSELIRTHRWSSVVIRPRTLAPMSASTTMPCASIDG